MLHKPSILTSRFHWNRRRSVGILLICNVDDFVLRICIDRWGRRCRTNPIAALGLKWNDPVLKSQCGFTSCDIPTTHDGMVLEILNLDDGWLAMAGGVGDLNGTLPCENSASVSTDFKSSGTFSRSFLSQVQVLWGDQWKAQRVFRNDFFSFYYKLVAYATHP